MKDNRDKHRGSRRKFLADLARCAGAAGLAAGAAACQPTSYFDYLTGNDVDRVNDRFNESMSGRGRDIVVPTAYSDAFTFIWGSDIHITHGQPNLMHKMGFYADQVGAKFILTSGDCVDQGLESEYRKWADLVARYFTVPVLSAIGNHDIYHHGFDRFLRYIGPSTFRFEYALCDFTFIDAATGTVGEDQMNWLEKVLQRNDDRKARFVLGHYPIYEGKIQTPSAMGNTEERMMLTYLFDEYNVDYYLCGHKHTGFIDSVRGVEHIIAGAASGWKKILFDDYHFWRFDVDGGHISRDKIYFNDVEII